MIRRSIRTDRTGAVAVEFAIIAPVFLMALFGLIEGARMLWTQEALDEAAYRTARCVMVGTDACNTQQKRINYAIARAKVNGLTVAAAGVSVNTSASCNGATGALLVTVQRNFGSPAAGLLPVPQVIEGRACLPKL